MERKTKKYMVKDDIWSIGANMFGASTINLAII